MMNCRTFQQNPESGPLNAAAQAHAASCAACARWHESQTAVSRLVGELPRVNAPADFDFRLRARLARTQETRAGYGWLRVPVGATLAGVLAFGAWWNVPTSTPMATTAGNLAATGTIAQLPQPQIEIENKARTSTLGNEARSFPVSFGATHSTPPIIARQIPARVGAAPPPKPLISGDRSLRSVTTSNAGRETVSLPAAPPIKIELHNQQTGRRALNINALTFGREARPSPAGGKTEAVIW